MKKKTVAITVAAAVFILALVAVTILVNIHTNKTPDSKLREHSIAHFYMPESTSTHFLVDGAALEDNIAGSIDAYLSVDGTVEIIRAATALYRADKEGILRIYPAAADRAVLSLDNRYILFNTPSKVMLYDHEAGEAPVEFNGLPDDFKKVMSLVMSPGGQTFAVSILENDGISLDTYICVNSADGTSGRTFTLFKEDSCICAVSDDGKTAYYMEALGTELTKKLYRVKNGSDKLIAENAEANFEINRDLTEITFDIDNKTYCSKNGGKPKLLTGVSCFSNAGKCYSLMGGELADVRLKDTDTLLNSVFYTYYSAVDESGMTYAAYDLFYVNSGCGCVPLAKGATQFNISPDGKKLFVLVDSNLCSVSVFDPERPVILFSNVYTYCADYEMENIYFIDTNSVLWHAPRGGERELVCENVFKSLVGSSGVCCFISDYDFDRQCGKLSIIKDGKAETAAEDVNNFETLSGMTLYYVRTGGELYDVYSLADGGTFNKVLSGVTFGKEK